MNEAIVNEKIKLKGHIIQIMDKTKNSSGEYFDKLNLHSFYIFLLTSRPVLEVHPSSTPSTYRYPKIFGTLSRNNIQISLIN